MAGPAPAIDIQPVHDFAALAPLWRDLESRADGSFFQSWAWTGCLAEERFREPWLLRARREDGAAVALALFNRRNGRIFAGRPFLLGESGAPEQDSIFIEHNGILIDRGAPEGLARDCWRALAATPGFSRSNWVVSGAAVTLPADLPRSRTVRVRARRPAPFLDFTASDGQGAPVLEQLSANLRQQLRRSLRAWDDIGPLTSEIAATPERAELFLDGLKALHQTYWTGRGKPGAFAQPFFERFHRALLRRAAPGQSLDLIRITAGERVVGYLYNLVHQGVVAAYQSGFDFSDDADRLRPGLICHLLAIEHYRRAGMRRYDFLGGEARYKRGFSNAEAELLWLDIKPKMLSFPGRSIFTPDLAA
jgi:CelD/BcsL family acetyltransferase involved in cellulose biosynthesis